MRYIYTRAANENMDIWDVSPSLVQDIVAKEFDGEEEGNTSLAGLWLGDLLQSVSPFSVKQKR